MGPGRNKRRPLPLRFFRPRFKGAGAALRIFRPWGRGKKIREKFVKTIAIVFPVVYNTALGPPGDRSVPGLYS